MGALIGSFLLIGALIWLRAKIQRLIQAAVLLIGGSTKVGVYVYTLLFLPGVILHEITHFMVAALLGVPTGEIHLLPQTLDDPKRVALGSVKVAKTDFIREAIIGSAPFVIGCVSLYLLVKIFFWPYSQLLNNLTDLSLKNLVVLYLIMAIANTMFLSSEDTRSFPGMIILFSLSVGILAITGSLVSAGLYLWPWVQGITQALAGAFLFVVGVDSLLMVVLFLWVTLLQKLTHKRVLYH